MMSNIPGKKVFFVMFLLILVSLSFSVSIIGAEQLTHTVQKGDTLWSICEKYYGDPDLWPKLWQMNPFITNPHFLHPGDRITLLEDVPMKKAPPAQEKPVSPTKEAEPAGPELPGVSLADYTKIEGCGFLSRTKVTPWGNLRLTEGERLLLGEGDKVLVDFEEREGIQPDQEYTICRNSDLLRHPLTNRKLGYLVAFNGRLAINRHLKRGIYEATILDATSPVKIGDFVIPARPVSSCVQPLSAPEDLVANIVATKGRQELIGQYSVVYLDKGLNSGIRRGNLFEVVEIKKLHDPDAETMTFREFLKYIQEKGMTDISIYELLEKFSKQRPILNIPLGKIMVIESRPDTATALVLTTKKNLFNGSFVKGVSFAEEPDFLLRMTRCAP